METKLKGIQLQRNQLKTLSLSFQDRFWQTSLPPLSYVFSTNIHVRLSSFPLTQHLKPHTFTLGECCLKLSHPRFQHHQHPQVEQILCFKSSLEWKHPKERRDSGTGVKGSPKGEEDWPSDWLLFTISHLSSASFLIHFFFVSFCKKIGILALVSSLDLLSWSFVYYFLKKKKISSVVKSIDSLSCISCKVRNRSKLWQLHFIRFIDFQTKHCKKSWQLNHGVPTEPR